MEILIFMLIIVLTILILVTFILAFDLVCEVLQDNIVVNWFLDKFRK